IAEAMRGQSALGLAIAPSLADRDAEALRDALCELKFDFGFARFRAFVARLFGLSRDGRQRGFVGDEWILDDECGRKEAFACDAMGLGGARQDERQADKARA